MELNALKDDLVLTAEQPYGLIDIEFVSGPNYLTDELGNFLTDELGNRLIAYSSVDVSSYILNALQDDLVLTTEGNNG